VQFLWKRLLNKRDGVRSIDGVGGVKLKRNTADQLIERQRSALQRVTGYGDVVDGELR
jgi:hypothetical protein